MSNNSPEKVVTIPNEYYLNQLPQPESGIKTTQHLLGFELVKGYGGLIHIDGAEFPRKGIIKTDAMSRLDVLKRTIREVVKYPYIFIFSSNTKLVHSFNVIFERAMHYDKAKQEYLCGAAIGMQKVAYVFLKEIGVEEDEAIKGAFNIAQFVEADDAYRYRLQDMAYAARIEVLQQNPRLEIKRLADVYQERELAGIHNKIAPIITIFSLLLLIPKYKKAFCKAIAPFKELAYDNADWYWCRMRTDYLHGGLSLEQRLDGIKKPTDHKVEIIYK